VEFGELVSVARLREPQNDVSSPYFGRLHVAILGAGLERCWVRGRDHPSTQKDLEQGLEDDVDISRKRPSGDIVEVVSELRRQDLFDVNSLRI
jgi:hypothetical protein